jgi:hypothetical protein
LGAWCGFFHLGHLLSWNVGVVGDRDVEKREGADVGACAVGDREGADAGGATSLLSSEGGFSVLKVMELGRTAMVWHQKHSCYDDPVGSCG